MLDTEQLCYDARCPPVAFLMTIPSLQRKYLSIASSAPGPWFSRSGSGFLPIVVAVTLGMVNIQQPLAAESGKPNPNIEQRVQELTPRLED
jgi:hypothetical protein